MKQRILDWLLASHEPWTRYRTLVDLLAKPEHDPETVQARVDMLVDAQVHDLIQQMCSWPGYVIKRHNDARHLIYALSVLADFGVRAQDPGVDAGIQAVLAHQSQQGAFQSMLNIHPRFGGSGEDNWSWMLCDSPTLLYALLAMGLGDDVRVRRAVEHLLGLVDDNGWRCRCAPELGNFACATMN